MSFDEARAYAKREGIRTGSQWQSKKDLDPRAPQDPGNHYKADWKGWHHFLGTEKLQHPTADEILAGCFEFMEQHGEWPHTSTPGDIPNHPGVKFRTADAALRRGMWGLAKVEKGLPGLLAIHRGVPLRLREAGLTKSKVDAAILGHAAESPGVSPLGRSKRPPGLAITFDALSRAMLDGRVEGIPKGTKWPEYCQGLGLVFRKHVVTQDEAETACRRFYELHERRLTTGEKEPILDGGLTGKALDQLFRRGHIEGCGKTTLTEFNDSLGIPQISKRGRTVPLSSELAKEWHPTKNGDLKRSEVTSGSAQTVWWLAACGHEWSASVGNRMQGSGCPYCAGHRVTPGTSLAALFPAIAAEWDNAKNGGVTPETVAPKSHRKAWFLCSKGHSWQSLVSNRTNGSGCPACNCGWSIAAIREFVRSLKSHLASLTPGELWVIFQQSGTLDSYGRGKAFVKALATGGLPREEIERFVAGENSLVDRFFDGPAGIPASDKHDDEDADNIADEEPGVDDDSADTLPTTTVTGVLEALNVAVGRSSDLEAIAFLVASAKAKLWRLVFRDEQAAVANVQAFVGTGYADTVRTEFLREYEESRSLRIPSGYAFALEGKPAAPNLMQRIVASRMLRERRLGNWSGTGSGKTNSAILASRVVGSKLTVVCCPNAVVDGWADAIKAVFPDSLVECKTFHPDWGRTTNHRFLVVNYEAFQQRDAEAKVREFTERYRIDFVAIDEIHYAKQRQVENMSRRRQMVGALLTRATEKNGGLYVLGMSATPVINNLREGVALVEMITGKSHDDLEVRPSVSNCMRLYQRLTTIGPRWMPDYAIGYQQREIEVDCSEQLDDIRGLGRRGSPLQLEQFLTKARLPTILDNIVPKTLIYTHYVEAIDRQLRDAVLARGWRVGFCTGEDKSGLNAFRDGDLDVLIGSSAIGTGVDGLQYVCNRLIINVLPWTSAEFEQLKGRIYRQGQARPVEMVIPITRADVNGREWSWCKSKMRRLHFKKSIADAAVDGVVPEGHLRSPEKAYQDLMRWLEQLAAGHVADVERSVVDFTLPDPTDSSLEKRRAKYGELSRLNARWNRATSTTTHERLERDPEEWRHYHEEYRAARATWTVVPYEEMIRWAQRREDLAIGDFGCGEAKLREALLDRHVVHSFDHVAAHDDVVACDMAHVPLDDETLDVAVFCLSLMGANFTDYLREAYRTLKLDGWLHIIEATSRFSNVEGFVRGLRDLGFGNIEQRDLWKFTHVSARKAEHAPRLDVKLRF